MEIGHDGAAIPALGGQTLKDREFCLNQGELQQDGKGWECGPVAELMASMAQTVYFPLTYSVFACVQTQALSSFS